MIVDPLFRGRVHPKWMHSTHRACYTCGVYSHDESEPGQLVIETYGRNAPWKAGSFVHNRRTIRIPTYVGNPGMYPVCPLTVLGTKKDGRLDGKMQPHRPPLTLHAGN